LHEDHLGGEVKGFAPVSVAVDGDACAEVKGVFAVEAAAVFCIAVPGLCRFGEVVDG